MAADGQDAASRMACCRVGSIVAVRVVRVGMAVVFVMVVRVVVVRVCVMVVVHGRFTTRAAAQAAP